MRVCYVVFTDPGRVFESIHRTVDGATAAASACGATQMPDGSAIIIAAVAANLRLNASISLPCEPHETNDLVHIERHPILI